jgi:hypothetical protein
MLPYVYRVTKYDPADPGTTPLDLSHLSELVPFVLVSCLVHVNVLPARSKGAIHTRGIHVHAP